MTEQEVYQEFSNFIQDYIYEKGWYHLSPLQIAAAQEIFQGENNLLLMAGTAQGKTEAAFLPAISMAKKKNSPSISILYISPLKALINDQFLRVEEMLNRSEFSLTKWHGDSSSSAKNQLVDSPNGILQMTPESLEAMFCLHSERIPILFSNLQFIIIDELHYFLGNERGLQLLILLERLEKEASCKPQRIGLSATIGNKDSARTFLSSGSQRKTKILELKKTGKKASISITTTPMGKEEFPEAYIKKILLQSQDKRSLLFANSRRMTELIITKVREMALTKKLPDIYYVHHGSIGKEMREHTEAIMKMEDGPILTATTMTLELGIDIGSLDQVIQTSDPPSISSMVQRLGRSGRRNGHSSMTFHLRYRPDKGEKKKMDLSLPRSMAMVELYFRQSHMEDQRINPLPYHMVIHTILSLICQKGCLQPKNLAREVLELSLYQTISQDDLRDILWTMMDKHLIKQYDDGALGLDDLGESIVNSMDFYAIFYGRDSMTVYYEDQEIGNVDRAYRPGDYFYLAGRSWEVIHRDYDARRLDVIPYQKEEDCEEEIKISYDGYLEQKTDQKTMEKIHEILEGEEEYSYLDKTSQGILEEIRQKAKRYQLLEEFTREHGSGDLLLHPCLSSQCILTIYHILKAHEIKAELIELRELIYGIRIKNYSWQQLKSFSLAISQEKHMIDYAYLNTKMKYHVKYAQYLPSHLRAKEMITDLLDLDQARQYFKKLSSVL